MKTFAGQNNHRLTAIVWLLVVTSPISAAAASYHSPPIMCKPSVNLDRTKTSDFPPPPADSRGFDVQSYDLDLRLDPTTRSISGHIVINLTAVVTDQPGELTVVQLDLVPELTVDQVSDSEGPLSFTHMESRLEVTLRQSLPESQSTALTITWHGQPPRHGITRTGLMFRTHDPGTPTDTSDDVPIIANKSETWSAHSWWPCKDHPADKALVSLAVTVPAELSAVSNGSLLAITEPEEGWRRFAWRELYAIPTYLVSVAVSNYDPWSEDCRPDVGSDVRLDYHFFPEDRAMAEFDMANTCDMLKFLTDIIGPWPYPGEKYAQVEFKWFGAMEHTTATSLGQALITGDRRYESIYLHELAHQWFGDSLTPAAWADIWLNEGFARYAEALWAEYRNGPDEYREFMHAIGPGAHSELFRGDGVLADPDPILPNALVYDKGAWVLHMLRGLIGDEAFFSFLKQYANDPRYQYEVVTTADMIAVAEAVAGRSLQSFFMPWLQTDLVPVITHEVVVLDNGTALLALQQHQFPVFEMPVPVVLHTDCGDVRVTVPLTAARQSFAWNRGCPVRSVSIAPEGLVLMRDIGAPPPPLRVTGPVPNPAGSAGSQFMLFPANATEVIVRVYDVKGMLISTENLGVIPGIGPSELPIAPGYPWQWHPTVANNQRPASGVYFIEFRGGDSREVRRVTLIH